VGVQDRYDSCSMRWGHALVALRGSSEVGSRAAPCDCGPSWKTATPRIPFKDRPAMRMIGTPKRRACGAGCDDPRADERQHRIRGNGPRLPQGVPDDLRDAGEHTSNAASCCALRREDPLFAGRGRLEHGVAHAKELAAQESVVGDVCTSRQSRNPRRTNMAPSSCLPTCQRSPTSSRDGHTGKLMGTRTLICSEQGPTCRSWPGRATLRRRCLRAANIDEGFSPSCTTRKC